MKQITKSLITELSHEIIGSAIKVHKQLGPGLLESIYQKCMLIELRDRGIKVSDEALVPIVYNERLLQTNLRIDILVEDLIILELKSVQELLPIHQAQLITYMKLLNAPKGFLFNFHCLNINASGRKTLLGESYRNLPE